MSTWRCQTSAVLPTLAILIVALLAVSADEAGAFAGHEAITTAGLADSTGARFLGAGVLHDINAQHDEMDSWPNGTDDERHVDDCDFDGASKFIRNNHGDAAGALRDGKPFKSSDYFGNLLHTAQDFYSHSNWVEMGFPLTDDPATPRIEVAQSDLVDFSGAQASLDRPWNPPDGGGVVRRSAQLSGNRWDILLGADDWDEDFGFPTGWSIAPNGNPQDPGGAVKHVPTLIDPEGRTRGKLLVTGEGHTGLGTGDADCDVYALTARGGVIGVFNGFKHNDLNKDSDHGDGTPADKQPLNAPAKALAVLQTGYEWCRLVRDAALGRDDGILLTMWVRPGANPHPDHTPCASASPGPVRVTVTIERITVLDAREPPGDDPGEIQVAAALYDSAFSFRRSVHTTNRSGRHMNLDDGDRVPVAELPPPFSLCVARGQRPTFALYAWDNDEGDGDPHPNAFDNEGDDDDVLPGVRRRLGRELHPRSHTATSTHLQVRYRVTRSNEAVASPLCVRQDRTPPS
jgi:hypothetical protein